MSKKNYTPGWRSQESRGNPTRRLGVSDKLRVLLPVGIVLVLGGIFLWPKMSSFLAHRSHSKIMGQVLKANPLLEDKVINPKLDSLDKKGRPFLIEAESANNLNDPKTDFVKPSGHIQLEDGSTMTFTGEKGSYRKESDELEVFGNVHIQTDKGYDLKTEYMKLFPKQNTGEGHKPIHGIGPSGETIEAEGFKISDKGDTIEFLGKTKISLPGK